MKKLMNICKRIVLPFTAVVFVAAMIGLIVVCCQPHGKTYTYEDTFFGVKMEIALTFENKDTCVIDTTVTDAKGQSQNQSAQGSYSIRNGKLYTTDEETGVEELVGKIDCFQIVFDDAALAENGLDGIFDEIVLKNHAGMGLRTATIVLMVISGILVAACITLLVLDKKGVFKPKKAAAEPKKAA